MLLPNNVLKKNRLFVNFHYLAMLFASAAAVLQSAFLYEHSIAVLMLYFSVWFGFCAKSAFFTKKSEKDTLFTSVGNRTPTVKIKRKQTIVVHCPFKHSNLLKIK